MEYIPLVVLGAVAYLALIRPQQKRQKEERALMSSLRAGDEVMTIGGIYGVIIEAPTEETFVWLDVAEETELKISKTAIKTIVSRDEGLDITDTASTDSADDGTEGDDEIVDESLES